MIDIDNLLMLIDKFKRWRTFAEQNKSKAERIIRAYDKDIKLLEELIEFHKTSTFISYNDCELVLPDELELPIEKSDWDDWLVNDDEPNE